MGRPKKPASRFSRWSYPRPRPTTPAPPLKCPKCGAPATQDAGTRSTTRGLDAGIAWTANLFFAGMQPNNAVRVVCSAGCPTFAVTLPKCIKDGSEER